VWLILACVALLQAPLIRQGHVPLWYDNLQIFYPLHDLMGKTLRSGHLPVWNPYQLSGTPLMGDPESGWGSLIGMLAYAALPLARASAVTFALHQALAALGTLLFLRSTGVSVAGSTVAALSYGLCGPMFGPPTNFSYGNLSYTGTYAWFPWMLLGIGLATRYRGRGRLAGWTLVAFAGSQELSVWAGQGAYYAFLGAGAYLVFLTLAGPPAEGRRLSARLRELAVHALALTVLSTVLSAWTLFPRVEFLLASSLRGGYGEGQQQLAGGAAAGVLSTLFSVQWAYVGAPIIVLALASALLRPGRAQLFYAGMSVLTYAVSLSWLVHLAEESAAARTALGLLPGVLQLHLHYPQRILFLGLFFGCALAGATLDRMLEARGRARASLPVAVCAALAGLLALGGISALAAAEYRLFLASTGVFAAVVLLFWAGRLTSGWASGLVVATTAVQLVYAVSAYNGGQRALLGPPERFLNPPATRASVALLRSAPERGRYFGYEPAALEGEPTGERPWQGYRKYRWEEWTGGLLVLSQGTVHRVEDAQGYNPMHLAVYDRLLQVANGGESKNYRDAYIGPRALASPLLDMLNIRYALTRGDAHLGSRYALMGARPRSATLYENVDSLPRAWVVHETVVSPDDRAALQLIDGGRVEPGRAAVVRRELPGLAPKRGAERVTVAEYRADRIRVDAELSSPGLLMLGELDYPAWKVEVDGRPSAVVRANGALRAVRVPEGGHTVVWYFDSTPTRLGFALTGLGLVVLAVAFVLWSRRPAALARQTEPRP
jgi:hypothetical protein